MKRGLFQILALSVVVLACTAYAQAVLPAAENLLPASVEAGKTSSSLLINSPGQPSKDAESVKPVSKPKEPKIFIPKMVKSTASPQRSAVVEQVIRDQLGALLEGDVSSAYYAFTSAEFQKNVYLSAFKQFVGSNRVLSRFSRIELDKPQVDGGFAKVEGHIVSRGQSQKVHYELIRENGDWKVNLLELISN